MYMSRNDKSSFFTDMIGNAGEMKYCNHFQIMSSPVESVTLLFPHLMKSKSSLASSLASSSWNEMPKTINNDISLINSSTDLCPSDILLRRNDDDDEKQLSNNERMVLTDISHLNSAARYQESKQRLTNLKRIHPEFFQSVRRFYSHMIVTWFYDYTSKFTIVSLMNRTTSLCSSRSLCPVLSTFWEKIYL